MIVLRQQLLRLLDAAPGTLAGLLDRLPEADPDKVKRSLRIAVRVGQVDVHRDVVSPFPTYSLTPIGCRQLDANRVEFGDQHKPDHGQHLERSMGYVSGLARIE